jgi:hypothetical protein
MNITIFRREDLKKTGGFKKKNNLKMMNIKEFKQYIKTNKLTLTKGYIDNIGYISNEEMFKCNYKGLIVGVTKTIQQVEENE